jgi:sporulation protein YlmC with PRC-barrel domain
MRAADLLGRPVTGPAGERLGHVLDVRVVQDGPMLGAFAALRVDGLVVGTRALASRLGYDRSGVEGPRILSALVHALMRGSVYVPWSDVEEIGDVVRTRTAEHGPVPRIP